MPAETVENIKPTGSRLVWVLNRDSAPYTENYNGTTVTIPPNHEKSVKMPFLQARHFLSRGKPAAVYTPTGKVVRGPKALYIEEIQSEIEAEADRSDGMEKTCMICMKKFQNKKALGMHVMRAHPDAEPAEEP